MSKIKSAAVLVALTATTLLSGCDPAASVLDAFGPADDLCADMGEGHCPVPAPDDLTPN
ncbi:MAG: hypothetical protein K0V04_21980 [Deltaproteobacteria bacterium]|nr:hypothetical protein [Deltaproteobacteria bacterium]